MTGGRAEQPRSWGVKAGHAVGQALWCLIPIVSLGLLTWVPALQAWWKARSVGWAVTAAILAVAAVAVAVGLVQDTDDNTALGMLYIAGAIGGTVAAVAGRRIVFAPPVQKPVDPDIKRVLQRRERRQEAHRIAETDVDMAIELGVGRPELGTSYDDGGLIDLNNASADAIVSVLGWSQRRAKAFVVDRNRREGYDSLTELMAISGVDPRDIDRLSDLIVLLPYGVSRRGERRLGPGS